MARVWAVTRAPRLESPMVRRGLEKTRERRLTDEPQSDARQGDPDLADRKVLVQMGLDPFDELRPPVAFFRKRFHLGRPHLDHRELRKHEERIEKQEDEGTEKINRHQHREPRVNSHTDHEETERQQ